MGNLLDLLYDTNCESYELSSKGYLESTRLFFVGEKAILVCFSSHQIVGESGYYETIDTVSYTKIVSFVDANEMIKKNISRNKVERFMLENHPIFKLDNYIYTYKGWQKRVPSIRRRPLTRRPIVQ